MDKEKQPSEETKRKILQFFLKTSVPRILAKEASKEGLNQCQPQEGLKRYLTTANTNS